MDGSKRTLFLVVSLAVFLAALGFSSARLIVRYRENLGKAESSFQTLKSAAARAMSGAGPADPTWRTTAKGLYRDDEAVLLVVLHSPGEGILHMVPRSSAYLSGDPGAGTAVPEFLFPPQTVARLSSVVSSLGGVPVTLEVLYSLLRQRDVYEAARIGLIIAAAWTALSLIAVTAAGLRRNASDGVPLAPASPVPDGAHPKADVYSSSLSLTDEDFSLPDIPLEPHPDSTLKSAPAAMGTDKAPHAPKGLYSPESGLGWEEYLAERLNAELSRAASFEQDLVLLEVSHEGIARKSSVYGLVTKTLLEFFNFRDLAFEQGSSGFAVILPNIDSDHALRLTEEFLKKITELLRKEGSQDYLKLFMGLSSRSGRLVDAALLVTEAGSALKKAKAEADSRIVAFKADPNKYRAFVAAR